MQIIKQKYIINRIILLVLFYFITNIIFLAIFFYRHISGGSLTSFFIFWIIFSILIIPIVILGIYKPYIRLNNYILSYNNGYNQKDVLKKNIHISEAIEEFINKMSDDIRTEESIKNSNKHAQYLALQNQINPHFLYNTLEGIRSDALTAGFVNIANIVESLGVYFRYTISKIDMLVTLDEEMANLNNYLVIQNYRFGEKIKMEEIYDSCDRSIRQCLIPKLVLQPFFENSIIHGLENKIEKGKIKIIFSITNELLLITIEDDGIGIPEHELNKINENIRYISMESESESIAVNNVNNRIKLLFGDAYGIKIRSVINLGTSVDITLPLKYKK